jgi:hypothetical protein
MMPSLVFDGETFDLERDGPRLTKQLGRVFDFMKSGEWRSLWQISEAIKGSEASVSARLRDLRKPRFGGFSVERRRLTAGLYQYRLTGVSA